MMSKGIDPSVACLIYDCHHDTDPCTYVMDFSRLICPELLRRGRTRFPNRTANIHAFSTKSAVSANSELTMWVRRKHTCI